MRTERETLTERKESSQKKKERNILAKYLHVSNLRHINWKLSSVFVPVRDRSELGTITLRSPPGSVALVIKFDDLSDIKSYVW